MDPLDPKKPTPSTGNLATPSKRSVGDDRKRQHAANKKSKKDKKEALGDTCVPASNSKVPTTVEEARLGLKEFYKKKEISRTGRYPVEDPERITAKFWTQEELDAIASVKDAI